MTNYSNSILYVGVTNNLARRAWEHKSKKNEGFTQKYNCIKLVYFEETNDISVALAREKQLKNWHRKWKRDLIEEINPMWRDLGEVFGWYKKDPGSSPG